MEWAVIAGVAVIAFLLGWAMRGLRTGEDSLTINQPLRSSTLSTPLSSGTPAQAADTFSQPANADLNAQSAPGDGLTPPVREKVEEFILRGKKIEAIKAYRKATNTGLKEAKDAVEEMSRRLLNPVNRS